jgi:lysophospholipase L1-like esterase
MKCSIFTPLAVAVGFSNQIRVVQGQARVLILGDSYASGNGARNATTSGSPNYAGIPDCYKSPTSFGGVFATLTNSTLIANRGCSGGLVSHVLNARPLVGSVPFDGSSCPNSPFAPEEVYTQVNSTSCSKSAQPQITAVDKNVDLILFAAGGNDLVFGDIVRYCLFFGFRDVSDCRDTINLVRSKLADVGQSLTEALVAMAPLIKAECKVVVVAYPHIVQVSLAVRCLCSLRTSVPPWFI